MPEGVGYKDDSKKSTRQDGLGKDGCPSGFKRDPATGKCVQKGVGPEWQP